ncbi:unnamed protein product [Amoebophrya sp. A25]|nr:unnamed protein product [Amoebophrya sp. A25]|eukprot:GSA25T00020461001.1
MGADFSSFLSREDPVASIVDLFDDRVDPSLTPEQSQKRAKAKEMKFRKLADEMIKSEAKTDFRLPYLKEVSCTSEELTKSGDSPANKSDGTSTSSDSDEKRIKRGIPIKYFTEHETLRWQWEEAGETRYASLIGVAGGTTAGAWQDEIK